MLPYQRQLGFKSRYDHSPPAPPHTLLSLALNLSPGARWPVALLEAARAWALHWAQISLLWGQALLPTLLRAEDLPSASHLYPTLAPQAQGLEGPV